ncbi:MAG TPA: KTSC domain-containing protein [Sphingopyxis sp.]|uniref:KTSC domain-containing protein n=1 Tax=Sphingopyxis sp. TaxID=1908224 RepID=UPI002CFFB600|nr:KTSC domain-containing protein [Sphingopyxis sp.]HWW55532.1 KTSC domain-containing protein [Sphingopyxis sp.]
MRFAVMRAHRFAESSMIDRIVYDDAARTLCVAFRDTGKYVYDGVPAALFDAFCIAGSAGTFFNERIKNRYRFRRDPERRRFGPNA